MSEGTIRVLHFSSRYEDCGVAKYLGHYVKGMADRPEIVNDYFDVSPYETHNMKPTDMDQMAAQLGKKLRDYDILHVQHEFALYAHDSFRRIIDVGKRSGKKIVVTVHISPGMHGASKVARLHGLGPRSWVAYLKEGRHHKQFMELYIEPFKKADLVLAHNNLTIQSLTDLGVDPNRIKKIVHPVQEYDVPPASTFIAKKLNKQTGDVIYCTTGFIHRYKGIVDAVKALTYLPSNYKLAILGGMKEDSDDVAFYNKLTDLANELGVSDRMYITGYVKTDDELNALIRECDISIYPYDRVYYAGVSSGTLNLSFSNGRPVIAYPTASIKELAADADGAVVLCETFAYYELARELRRIDREKQAELSRAYAKKKAWSKVARELADVYQEIVAR